MLNIYYDGDCPFCTNYVRLVQIKENFDDVHLVNLRDDKEKRDYFINKGYDLDKGMVVQMDDAFYAGHEAINKLALVSTDNGVFNQFNKFIFSNSYASFLLYPMLVFFRNLTLYFLGRDKLNPNPDGDNNQKTVFTIFAWFWALYALFHYGYLVYYGPVPHDLSNSWSYLIPIVGMLLIYKPSSRCLFFSLIVIQFVDMIAHMPSVSNHSIIELFFTSSVIVSMIYGAIRSLSIEDVFTIFASVGRWLLLIMYVFGIFHKINTDFLNPESSCAVFLWGQYPFPQFVGEGEFFHYLAIYGTFIIEGLVLLGLLFSQTRYYVLVVGVAFHIFLGLSLNAYYPAFSALSIALHSLFLPASTIQNFARSKWFPTYEKLKDILFVGFLVLILFLSLLAHAKMQIMLIVIFAIIILPCLIFIILFGHKKNDYPTFITTFFPSGITVIFAMMFFLNNIMPYVGLKTHQSMNMFANLRVENNQSNHLIIKNPPYLFPYTNDIVRDIVIRDPDGEIIAEPKGTYTYYDILNKMDRMGEFEKQHHKFSFIRNGEIYSDMTPDDLKDDMNSILHSRFIRKFIHFTRVEEENPVPCYQFKPNQ